MKKIKGILIFTIIWFINFVLILNVHANTETAQKVYLNNRIGYSWVDSLHGYLEENANMDLYAVVELIFNDKSNSIFEFSEEEITQSYDISRNNDGSVMAYLVDNVLCIEFDGKLMLNERSTYFFAHFENLQSIKGMENIDTSEVVNMEYMFMGLNIENIDLSHLNTSKVKNMSNMFRHSTVTTINLNSFDTSNVTDMSYMFSYTAFTKLDLSGFDTSNVTDMSYMFSSTNFTELDLSSFDTSNVTNMSYMFYNNARLQKLNLSSFNTSKVINMSNMFAFVTKLKSLNVSNFNTQRVNNMSSMFSNCHNLTELDLSAFNTSNVINMSAMFDGSYSLVKLNLSKFNTSKVADMSYMFRNTAFTSIDLSSFDTSRVTSMDEMFSYSKITTIDLSNFDTSNVTSMRGMFLNCLDLIEIDLSGLDTSNVINMSDMFYECKSLEYVNLSDLDTATLENVGGLFYGCTNLKEINFGNFNTSSVTYMGYMFYGCENLESINLTSFDTSKVTNMAYMFGEMYSLISLDLSNFDTGNVTNMTAMFSGCTNMKMLDISSFDTSNVDEMNYMFSWNESLIALDLSSFKLKRYTNVVDMLSNMSSLQKIIAPDNMSSLSITLPVSMYDDNNVEYTELKNISSGTVLRTKYTIYFDNDIPSREILYDTKYGELPTIENSKYEFQGWYTSKNFDTKITSDTYFLYDHDIFLYAKLSGPATFISGSEFNTKLKQLFSVNSIEYIRRAEKINENVILTQENIVSDLHSRYPIYIWQEENVIYYYTEEANPRLSENSAKMFSNLTQLKHIDLKTIDTSIVTNISNLFYGCYNLKTLDLSSFNTSNVTNMSYMFYDCEKLETINLNGFDTSNVTNMEGMFYNCFSLVTLDLSSFDTSNVTNMSKMFKHAGEIVELDLSHFNTSKLTNIEDMFVWNQHLHWFKPFQTNLSLDLYYTYYDQNLVEYSNLKDIPSNTTLALQYNICFTLDENVNDYDYNECKKILYGSEYGELPIPEKEGYVFKGWYDHNDQLINSKTIYKYFNMTRLQILIAKWEPNKYTVTWNNYDGTILEEKSVEYGVIPIYDGETPTKASTEQYAYVFAGWDKEINAVTEDIIYVATYTTIKKASLLNANTVSFKDNLSLNFLVELGDRDIDGTFVKLRYKHYGEDKEVIVPINVNDKNGKYYRFRCPLTASEMMIPVTAELYLKDTTEPVSTFTRSIREYIVAGLNNPNASDAEKALFRATLNYGGYTQKRFNYNGSPYAYDDYKDDISNVKVLSEVNFVRPEGYIDGIKYVGSSVFFRNAPYVRYYFELESGVNISDYIFKIGEYEILPTKKDNRYYIESTPALAYQLDDEQNITVTKDNSNIMNFSYSIIKWAEIAVANTTNEDESNMAKAMYTYYLAAKAFVDSNS